MHSTFESLPNHLLDLDKLPIRIHSHQYSPDCLRLLFWLIHIQIHLELQPHRFRQLNLLNLHHHQNRLIRRYPNQRYILRTPPSTVRSIWPSVPINSSDFVTSMVIAVPISTSTESIFSQPFSSTPVT